MNKSDFQHKLRSWFKRSKRELPWRETIDPYNIWLSEIILQQTRVNQGLPYYQKFIKNYPNVKVLANASEDAVLKDWEGLGYYSRARNLHAAAKFVCDELNGDFPKTYTELLQLKGVGEYTAAAIASFAFNEPKAVVDGNVFRVLSRLYGEETFINSTAGKKRFQQLADELLDRKNPANHNQAIMEFGALQCLPKNPQCDACSLNTLCVAYKSGRVDVLPRKQKKIYNQLRYFNYLSIENEGDYAYHKRVDGIWKGLHQFPLIETNSVLDFDELVKTDDFQSLLTGDFELRSEFVLKAHKLSHQTIYIKIYHLILVTKSGLRGSYNWFNKEQLKKIAWPRPLADFLEQKQLNLPLSKN